MAEEFNLKNLKPAKSKESFDLLELNKFNRLVDSYEIEPTTKADKVEADKAEEEDAFERETFHLDPEFINSLKSIDEFDEEAHKPRKLATPRVLKPGGKDLEKDKKTVINELVYNYHAGLISDEDLLRLERMIEPRLTKYIPHIPTPKQAAFLLLTNREAFYGGAAGGGKSDALLMAALQYVDIPGYRAILFRRTYADLSLPGALMDRAHTWLSPFPDVKWNEKDKTFTFPSGATLTFGYLEHDNDKYRYQGSEFQFIGFDELTHITLNSYRYMFSRLRRLLGSEIPLRVRGASNPGGTGHEWVKLRFLIEGPEKNRVFIPAGLDDNPHLDADEYKESLAELDPITREQLMNGNWEVKTDHGIFDRDWFEIIDAIPPGYWKEVRYWDFAATEVKPGKDPDWTVGLKLLEQNGIYIVADIRRKRARPSGVETLVKNTAMMDGTKTYIYVEQEPGASGVQVVDYYARNVLKGYAMKGNRNTGNKVERARPVSSAAEQGRIMVLRANWNSDFFDELEAFPMSTHDDQVDAFSGAFSKISTKASIYAMPIATGTNGSYWGGI